MFEETNQILLGRAGEQDQYLALKWANRHGLIAGATGTGKTVTLQVMAEGFSRAGVPVFLADVKGDISALSVSGADKDFLVKRASEMGLADYRGQAFPVTYWDVLGVKGHPIRARLDEIGPLLLARMLELNETQGGVLNIAYHLAGNKGWPLIDLADLRAVLVYMADHASEVSREIGQVAPATIGTIQRRLLEMETQNGAAFFGEPALDIHDFIKLDATGQGVINILAADQLIRSPRVYATFLLWLLTQLFEKLPEAGDLARPKIAFFFDEAHLLFDGAPRALLERIEQVVRLIRSKGVGIYFVTQSPTDIPEDVAAQLGNRVQHALRSFTPQGKKAVMVAAETLRPNPAFDTATVIGELAVGEALVSVLFGKGEPSVVQRTLVCPPRSRMGPVDDDVRRDMMRYSPVGVKYDQRLNRESAAELAKAQQAAHDQSVTSRTEAAKEPRKPTGRPRDTLVEAAMKSTVRTIGSSVGREIVRVILKSLTGRR